MYHPISYGCFDANIYIFNCKNGTLHMDTGEFTEHRCTDFLTKISPVVYDPTAHSERFDSYIQEIMSGEAKFLQKIFAVDFLQKKMKVNEGEVSQYYVEHSLEAIIAPEE